jgi:hypothetical protein
VSSFLTLNTLSVTNNKWLILFRELIAFFLNHAQRIRTQNAWSWDFLGKWQSRTRHCSLFWTVWIRLIFSHHTLNIHFIIILLFAISTDYFHCGHVKSNKYLNNEHLPTGQWVQNRIFNSRNACRNDVTLALGLLGSCSTSDRWIAD